VDKNILKKKFLNIKHVQIKVSFTSYKLQTEIAFHYVVPHLGTLFALFSSVGLPTGSPAEKMYYFFIHSNDLSENLMRIISSVFASRMILKI
jgi:hypothetical protein